MKFMHFLYKKKFLRVILFGQCLAYVGEMREFHYEMSKFETLKMWLTYHRHPGALDMLLTKWKGSVIPWQYHFSYNFACQLVTMFALIEIAKPDI